jgi:hypothetical protein
MNNLEQIPEHWQDLIEKYLDGSLDESGMQELEDYLCSEEAARQYFVRYARLHTDLQLEMRARRARVVECPDRTGGRPAGRTRGFLHRFSP